MAHTEQHGKTTRIAVVGISGDEPVGKAAWHAIETADVLVGGHRHLNSLHTTCQHIPIEGDIDSVLDAIESESGNVCVVSSGDPGFFGMVRSLSKRFGPERLDVHPAPSSVSLAFARVGLAWDDAVVVSAHGRPLRAAIHALGRARKAAVLTSPTNPPQAVGQALIDESPHQFDQVIVCSHLGEPDESITRCSVKELADGTWDPLSVLILISDSPSPSNYSLSWGLPETSYLHRDGMITKAEVRAVAISKLRLPSSGVLWDVGAGSGSVAIECASLSPGLEVIAIERSREDASRITTNAVTHGVHVEVVVGEAPSALENLPKPDRVFVGGGGVGALDAVLTRIAPHVQVVATYASLDRALQAYKRLGSMVQVSIGRAETLAGETRLVANNPVFVAWGSKDNDELRY